MLLLGRRQAFLVSAGPARRHLAASGGRHGQAWYRLFSAESCKRTAVKPAGIRNIGVIAHIDAGKTTTTERMLFYTGKTKRIGNVDEGSTVTDFLPAERARGITIQSAVVSMDWRREGGIDNLVDHQINLIDTPGHVDFNFEVIRSLRILDGAVCVLDGVEGVEAQTEAVWAQAAREEIPRILFVNKMDRTGASFRKSVLDVASRLAARPMVCQIPWFDRVSGDFCGIVDVVGLRGLRWKSEDPSGRSIELVTLPDLARLDPGLAEEVGRARQAMVEALSDFDDKLVEQYFELDEDHLAIPEQTILAAIRQCVLAPAQTVVPVLCGASFRNIGVQPLLDAVVDFLPAPSDRPEPVGDIVFGGDTKISARLSEILSGKAMPSPGNPDVAAPPRHKKYRAKATEMVADNVRCCALAFKVVNDPLKGMLVYVRVYHGALERNGVVFNTNVGMAERVTKVLVMQANESVEQSSVPAGHIAVLVGLKHVRTGDTLVGYAGLSAKAGSAGPPPPLDSLELVPIAIPPPVFFVAIEPTSPSGEKDMWDALNLLLREDPSLRITIDPESGQAQLSGLGELHLEISTDRLKTELRARVNIGPIEIGYRETLLSRAESDDGKATVEREFGGCSVRASCKVVVLPSSDISSPSSTADDNCLGPIELDDDNSVTIRTTGECTGTSPLDLPRSLTGPISNAVLAGLSRGPRAGYPVHSCRVEITFPSLLLDSIVEMVESTTGNDGPAAISAITASVRAGLANALSHLKKSSSETSLIGLMEPMMLVKLAVDQENLGRVVHDIASARGGQIISLSEDEIVETKVVTRVSNQQTYCPPDHAGPTAHARTGQKSVDLSSGRSIKNVYAKVPLAEMVGYDRHLRALTKGRGSFTMTVDRFDHMTGLRQKNVLTGKR